MKKSIFAVLTAVALLATSCGMGYGNSGYGNTGYGTTTGSTGSILTNVLGSILGNVLLGGYGLDASSLAGNWAYNGASAAFTNQQTLTKAGGVEAANNLINQLAPKFQAAGITKKNTTFQFGADNTFAAQVHGIPFNGTYTFNQANGEIALKSAAQTLKGNVMKTTNGIALMFDANQMATMLQKVGQVDNATAIEAVKQLAKSQDGARVGFELTK
ncbi:MAG: DUF4923 family protein [Muribaculaceae bacterium]|nr:DUF4923 family protein [Muribaculaceae bacterium]